MHGLTKIPSRGFCIYCGKDQVKLTDEHVVPLGIGGQHILVDASCQACNAITGPFEQHVLRDMWAAPRSTYNSPTRRPKERKKTVTVRDAVRPDVSATVASEEYPAPFFFYRMSKAGLLQGLSPAVDISANWQIEGTFDEPRYKAFKEKYGIEPTMRFRHMPASFGRMIAKIGYCNALTMLDPGDFDAICVPYILGHKSNISYVVGGSLDPNSAPTEFGYHLSMLLFGDPSRAIVVAEVRLLANAKTPVYHVVVGAVSGRNALARVVDKMGPGTTVTYHSPFGWAWNGPPQEAAPDGWPLSGLDQLLASQADASGGVGPLPKTK